MANDFDQELNDLSYRPQNRGQSAILIVNLLSDFPHRAGEIVKILSFPLDGWNFIDVKNLWCALIMGHKSIGQNGLTQKIWEDNCRDWLARQTHLKGHGAGDLVRLAIGYGSAAHTLRSLNVILDQAKEWGGPSTVQKICQSLAEPAMAHALDGRDECGMELLRTLCQTTDMKQRVGAQIRQDWLYLWANMSMDGQNADYVERALEIIITEGVDKNQLDDRGYNILRWVQAQSIEPHTNDVEILAEIVGSLLSHGWSLDDPAMKASIHKVRPLLEAHPAVKRRKLQEVAVDGKRKTETDDERGTIVM